MGNAAHAKARGGVYMLREEGLVVNKTPIPFMSIPVQGEDVAMGSQ